MKKYLLGIFTVALALIAMSFQSSTTSLTTDYYWYRASDGVLLNEIPTSTPPTGCAVNGGITCAYGHTRMLEETEDPSDGNPFIVKFQ